MTTPRRSRAALCALLLASCHSNTKPLDSTGPSRDEPAEPPQQPPPPRQPIDEQIRRLELKREPSPELRALLRDESAALRGRAAIAVGRVADPEAAAALGALLADRSIGDDAAWALGRLPEPKPGARAAQKSSETSSRQSSEASSQKSSETSSQKSSETSPEAGLLASPEKLLRDCVASRCPSAPAAARALGGQGRSAETIAVLTAAVTARPGDPPGLANRAATALGILARIGGKGADEQVAATARDALWTALADPASRKGAAYALGRIPRDARAASLEAHAASPEAHAGASDARGASPGAQGASPGARAQGDARTPALLAALSDPDAETRALAARAAGKQQADAELLRPALDDPDWRVQVEAARALASAPGGQKLISEAIAKSAAKLAAAKEVSGAKWAHPLVELFAAAAKVGIATNSLPAAASLSGPTAASTLAARCALAEARDRRAGAPFETKSCGAGLEPEWRSRFRLAGLAGELAGEHRDGPAGRAVLAALRDGDPRVRSAAAQSASMAFGDELIERLDDPDPIVVSSAASSLAKDTAAARASLPAASRAVQRFLSSRGSPAGDPRSDALAALADLLAAGIAPLAGPPPRPRADGPLVSTTTPPDELHLPRGAALLLGPQLLDGAPGAQAPELALQLEPLRSPPLARSLAALLDASARLLPSQRQAGPFPSAIPPPVPREAEPGLRFTPRRARDAPPMTDLILSTTAGELRVRLDLTDAPLTSSALAALANRGFYDHLLWHRVVPDFVAQGGDPLGDGEGGPGWSLPDEHGPREFRRGTLGIATSGPETGGSQIFFCHSAQPHLDGRYTVAGELEQSDDALDALQVGDELLSAKAE